MKLLILDHKSPRGWYSKKSPSININNNNTSPPEKQPTPAELILSLLRSDPDGKFNNVFEVLTSVQVLRLAYETIKSKSGNMVKGSDKETLDGISLDWFSKTSLQLRSEKFSFRPNRRMYIPKANGKKRPLGIASPRDKIIQQAMNMVMETVLEPTFHETSHGFRPFRGCHSALQQVHKWWGVPWIVEGDIKAFFDTIDHHILANLLHKSFAEKRLFNLYWKFVKAGYIEYNSKKKVFVAADTGVPQGGILSPLLSNVILHELDKFVEKRRLEFEKSNIGVNHQKTNPRYVALSDLIDKCRANKARKEMVTAMKLRRNLKSRIPNPQYSRIEYVRYADDWLLGVWGPRSLAVSLKTEIASFLQSLKLTLSEEKTLITNLRRKKVKFLGTFIRRITPTRGPLAKPKAAGRLWMTAPFLYYLSVLERKASGKWVEQVLCPKLSPNSSPPL